MVADCPSSAKLTASALWRNCVVDIDEERKLVSHYIPVKIKSIVYRNIFCALCFGQNVTARAYFWPLDVGKVAENRYQACLRLKERLQKHEQIPLSTLKATCGSLGFFTPGFRYWYGPDRLGKICPLPSAIDGTGDDHGSDGGDISQSEGLDEPDRRQPFKWPLTTQSLSTIDQACLKTMEQLIRRKQNPSETNVQKRQIYFLKTVDKYLTISPNEEELAKMCLKCDENLLSLITIYPRALRPYFAVSGIGTDGKITIFFDSPDVVLR